DRTVTGVQTCALPIWAVVEYLAATGDGSVLDERAAYLEAEQPLPPLPAGKGGMGFDPLRSSRDDTVYRHGLRAVDLVLGERTGRSEERRVGKEGRWRW